jgi:phage repressor protein C with HTH and peptisase S24 domain
MNIDDLRRHNLARYIEIKCSGNRSEFARQIGKQSSYILGVLMKENPRTMSVTTVRDMEEKLGLPQGYWDTEHTEEELQQQYSTTSKSNTANAKELQSQVIPTWESEDELDTEEYILVPESTLCLSAGNGFEIIHAEDAPPHAFRHSYFKSLHMKPANARVWEIRGNSMAKGLNNGYKVMVDTGRTILKNECIFAMVYNNELYIKRIFKQASGSILLQSDNEEYQAHDLVLDIKDQVNLTVIGQVVDIVSGRLI